MPKRKKPATPLHSVLIANRGEIARRIIRSCKELGIRSIAVYAWPDRHAAHVSEADAAYCLGEFGDTDSYLNAQAILKIASLSKAAAIHPGYGFLSENSAFARQVCKAGIIFVGPPADAIELLGDKLRAKLAARKAGVPTLPWIAVSPDAKGKKALRTFAAKSGYPLLIKAAAGGGGRGMRVVQSAEGLDSALEQASAEALKFFGDGTVYAERYLARARHIEVQVMADNAGSVLIFGDRDCTFQRRNQKIIEEAPAPKLKPELRRSLHQAAKALCQAARYRNAGTVEFLLDQRGDFYFLEVNSRLQVEHPVTEQVFGVDLVALQFKVAAGEPLPKRPPRPAAHAIELRICAERPQQEFAPSTGSLLAFDTPQGAGARVESAVRAGDSVTHLYDSLICKVIVSAKNRQAAIVRAQEALSEVFVAGVDTNLNLLSALLNDRNFTEVTHHTRMIEELRITGELSQESLLLHALLAAIEPLFAHKPHLPSAAGLQGFRNAGRAEWSARVSVNGTAIHYHARWISAQQISAVTSSGVVCELDLDCGGSPMIVSAFGLEFRPRYRRDRALDAIWVRTPLGVAHCLSWIPPAEQAADGAALHLNAPLPGQIIEVCSAVGAALKSGETIAILESMKMQHPIRAPRDGVLAQLNVVRGQQLTTGKLIAIID